MAELSAKVENSSTDVDDQPQAQHPEPKELKAPAPLPVPDGESMLYINQMGKWVDGPVTRKGDMIVHRVRKTFKDIWWYYANIIDYGRCVLAVIALFVILYAPAWDKTIGALIMLNVLLDWVDGPVARAYNQSSMMGAGWDWLADLLAQYCLAIWCTKKETAVTPFVVLFTVVEITTGLFDFAITAQAVYPTENTDLVPWYFAVERWMTPGGSYNHLGTSCWLINTIFPIACCLEAPTWMLITLAPFAVLYAWHEVVQACFIVSNWRETTASHASGILYIRSCVEDEKRLLKSVYERAISYLKLAPKCGEKEIYWGNLCISGACHEEYKKDVDYAEFEKFVRSLAVELYPDVNRELVSYGFIVSPKNGEKTQRWHYDYETTCSNIFISMAPTTHKNATQYLRHPNGPMVGLIAHGESTERQYYEDPHLRLEAEKTDHIEVCQLISEPFVITKLQPGCIHRGIANGENYDRILFFLTTNTAGVPVDISESHVYNYAEGNGNKN